MSAHVLAPVRAAAEPDRSGPYAHRLLQRSCDCLTEDKEEKCEECEAQAPQPKLVIGPADDPLEREADHAADLVVSGQGPRMLHAAATRGARRGGPGGARASVGRALASPGAPLDGPVRQAMERRFGHDFARVRVHRGGDAERSAHELSARAYTVGQDVVFGTGQYAPGTDLGRRLLAHELAHVVQQSGGTIRRQVRVGGLPPTAEVDFDALADQVYEAMKGSGTFLGLGWGTDEEAVYQALEQLRGDPGMIATLVERYAQRHDNADMVADIEDEFSGSELEYARQLLGRGRAGAEQRVEGPTNDLTAAARRLRDAVEGPGTDEEAIYATLVPFNRATEALENTYRSLCGESLREHIVDEMSGSERRHALSLLSFDPESFLSEHFPEGQRAFARRVMNDVLAVRGTRLDFADEAELASEISKRLRTSQLMQESQTTTAFGYPESCTQDECPGACVGHGSPGDPDHVPPNINYNAHVNKPARQYWRRAPTTGFYVFVLTDEGLANPYRALVTLFEPQTSICDMTLIHCDYLTTVIHLRAFAESIGTDVFDKRVRSGAVAMELSYYGFLHVRMPGPAESPEPGYARFPEAVSLQSVRPASEDDLVIGDHVIFWNHLAYDALTASPTWQGPWRLENALVVDQDASGQNLFLGHGAPTNAQGQVAMGDKQAVLRDMVGAYNDPANAARALAGRVESNDQSAQAALSAQFPRVVRAPSGWGWLIMELDDRDENRRRPQRSYPLRPLTGPDDPDLIGLRDPTDPSKMGWVKRPIESAPGRSPSQPRGS